VRGAAESLVRAIGHAAARTVRRAVAAISNADTFCAFFDRWTRCVENARGEGSIVTTTLPGAEYTRVNEDASILCKRQDFPRALNILQRRMPDHRRWRAAFRGVARNAVHALDGARRQWMVEAVTDLVTQTTMHPWLRAELAVDLHGSSGFEIPGVLPEWTARDVWALAEREGLPMQYVTQVTSLPRAIDDRVDTAQLVVDFRETALAHRRAARELHDSLTPRSQTEDAIPFDDMLVRLQIEGQRDASERWRGLSRRLLLVQPRGSLDACLSASI